MMAGETASVRRFFHLPYLAIVILIVAMETTYITPSVICESERSSLFKLNEILDNLVFSGPSLIKYYDVNLIIVCAYRCSTNSECLSFFYNKATATCDLRSNVVDNNTSATTVSQSGSKYYQLQGKCTVLPSIVSGRPEQNVTSMASWNVGDIVSVVCEPNLVLYGQLMCVGEEKWKIPECRIPSCSALKSCNENAGDGEYWLYPQILEGQKVKVYCSNMASDVAEDYITLESPNIGISPDLSNKNCEGETASVAPDLVGVASFSKIRINLDTMEVIRNDVKFATITSRETWDYGIARDSYAIHYSGQPACGGPKGTFVINTTMTGLIVKTTVSWTVFGWNPYQIVERSADGKVIRLRCGGWTGWCQPSGPLLLELNQNEVLPEDSATYAKCG